MYILQFCTQRAACNTCVSAYVRVPLRTAIPKNKILTLFIFDACCCPRDSSLALLYLCAAGACDMWVVP